MNRLISASWLPEPEFIEMAETFRVNLFRSQLSTDSQKKDDAMSVNVGENVGDVGEKIAADGDAKKIVMQIISDNDVVSAAGIAKKMSVTQRTVERYIQELRVEGKLIRHGSARGGHWEIVKQNAQSNNP
jgi:ATP-dependent DNA helicase RecG